MPGFLYFVPGRPGVNAGELPDLGLSYALGDGPLTNRQCSGGPGGADGVLLAGGNVDPADVRFDAARQVWRPVPGKPYQVGHWADAAPAPEDLERADLLPGYVVTLLDGRRWLAPIARGYREAEEGDDLKLYWSVQLPQRLDLAADGQWAEGSIVGRYAALWEFATAWFAMRRGTETGDEAGRLGPQGRVDAAVLALQANYRLGRTEAALLGLLSSENVLQILDRLIDEPKRDAFLKKVTSRAATKQEEAPAQLSPGSPLNAGPAAVTRTTAPALPT